MEAISDSELAARIAGAAGDLLVRLRQDANRGDAAVGTAGDLLANRLILDELSRWRPEDAVLSEESPDRPERLARSRVWIVDPLDGTREYVDGRDDWAVHVALAVDGAPAAGAVAVPMRGRVFRSDDPRTASAPLRQKPRMAVSRTRRPPHADALANALGAEIVEMGSAGAKAMAVVAGEAEIYFHAGGQHEWDNCAPVAVALGAGLYAGRCDGTPIRYNEAPPFVSDLLICRAELAPEVIGALARLSGDGKA